MKTVLNRSALTVALCLLVTSLSIQVQAQPRDSLGSIRNNGVNVTRYSLPDKHSSTNYRNQQGHRRDRDDVSVNIIVGAVPGSRYYRPDYRNYDHNRYYSNTDSLGFVFNSSLGYISNTVIRTLGNDHHDYHDYETPRNVVRITERRSDVITLYRDRFDQCYEVESDRYGREFRRRVSKYKCDF